MNMELNLERGKGRRRNTSSAFGRGEDFMKRLESTEWSRADGACDLIGLLLSFSCSVMSNSLWPHGLQHARLPCPLPSLGVCSNSCPLSQWYHPTIQPSNHLILSPTSPALNLSQHLGLFEWVGFSHQVAKLLELQLQHQSFQWIIRLISFRIDWFDLHTQ